VRAEYRWRHYLEMKSSVQILPETAVISRDDVLFMTHLERKCCQRRYLEMHFCARRALETTYCSAQYPELVRHLAYL
jgi:hypothetical protein